MRIKYNTENKLIFALQLFITASVICPLIAVDQRLESKGITLASSGASYVAIYAEEYVTLLSEFATGETPIISINTKNIKALFTGDL